MKEKLKTLGKTVLSYALLVVALGSAYLIGANNAVEKDTPLKEENCFFPKFSPAEISVAVNEENDLLLIDKKTGKYKVYTEDLGLTIFKMYAKKIRQQATD